VFISYIEAMKWYDKYIGLPYYHLGFSPEKGIDCFNLITYLYREELGIDIPYKTGDFCKVVDEHWYTVLHKSPFDLLPEWGWEEIEEPELYSVILMTLGSANVMNHCAMYIEKDKILHTMAGHKSWIAPYGRHYKQYTNKVYKWAGMNN